MSALGRLSPTRVESGRELVPAMDPPMRVPQFGGPPIPPAIREINRRAIISRLKGALLLDAAIDANDEEAILAHGRSR